MSSNIDYENTLNEYLEVNDTAIGNEEEENKNHWVATLFAPKFDMNNLQDVEINDEKPKWHQAKDFYSQIYSKVILEEEIIREKEERKRSTPIKTNKKAVTQDNNKSDIIEDAAKNNLWDAKDIKVFRDAYEKLKAKTVKLLCILESRNLKINSVKTENKSLKANINGLEKINNTLRKENECLKSFSISHKKISEGLEERLQFHEDSKLLMHEKLNTLKKELFLEKKNRMELQSLTEQQKKQLLDLVKFHEDKLETNTQAVQDDFQSQLEQLENENKGLCVNLKTKDKELFKVKEALSILQRHFDSSNIITVADMNHEIKNKKSFLDVLDT